VCKTTGFALQTPDSLCFFDNKTASTSVASIAAAAAAAAASGSGKQPQHPSYTLNPK
jgi:hypothetical protein